MFFFQEHQTGTIGLFRALVEYRQKIGGETWCIITYLGLLLVHYKVKLRKREKQKIRYDIRKELGALRWSTSASFLQEIGTHTYTLCSALKVGVLLSIPVCFIIRPGSCNYQ